MPKASESPQSRWLSLGTACRMLEVSQATLRSWANRGIIRTYRTPGGHRRFSRDDLQALVDGTASGLDGKQGHNLGDLALRRIRQRLHGRTVVSQHWYETVDEESRNRLRLFGRRLLSLAMDYLSRRGRRSELLEEARFLGEEYGTEMARLSLSLQEVMQAFSFFRNSLMDGLQEALGSSISSTQVYQAWQQVNLVTDEVLQAIARAYQRSTKSMTAAMHTSERGT